MTLLIRDGRISKVDIICYKYLALRFSLEG